MKILQIHNYYDRESPSGENLVVDMERDLLKNAGNDVAGLYVYNDEINEISTVQKLQLANNWLGFGPKNQNFEKLVSRYNPDIVHIHNTFPFLGRKVLDAIANIPTVLTVHNYRWTCINGLKLRKGKICNRCDSADTNIFVPTVSKCYRNSVIQSLFASYGLSRLRKNNYLSKISHFIALTDFQQKYLMELGVSEAAITIKPNAYNGYYINNYNEDSRTILFIGRLSEEKGILNLLQAWKSLNPKNWVLKIIGSGPLSNLVNQYKTDPTIEVCGKLQHDLVMSVVSSASFIVVPSLWYEGYPMVIREAIARGIPSLVSEIGSTAAAVSQDIAITFNPNDIIDFRNKLEFMMNDSVQRKRLSMHTEDYFNNFLEVEKNMMQLQQIYKKVING